MNSIRENKNEILELLERYSAPFYEITGQANFETEGYITFGIKEKK